ncbi:hypothetical protein F4825DRAFT_447613 [Nemania diffusa]|nr:hypothetical protein F4825DRAFT_447613 [Nemania diffusa]
MAEQPKGAEPIVVNFGKAGDQQVTLRALEAIKKYFQHQNHEVAKFVGIANTTSEFNFDGNGMAYATVVFPEGRPTRDQVKAHNDCVCQSIKAKDMQDFQNKGNSKFVPAEYDMALCFGPGNVHNPKLFRQVIQIIMEQMTNRKNNNNMIDDNNPLWDITGILVGLKPNALSTVWEQLEFSLENINKNSVRSIFEQHVLGAVAPQNNAMQAVLDIFEKDLYDKAKALQEKENNFHKNIYDREEELVSTDSAGDDKATGKYSEKNTKKRAPDRDSAEGAKRAKTTKATQGVGKAVIKKEDIMAFWQQNKALPVQNRGALVTYLWDLSKEVDEKSPLFAEVARELAKLHASKGKNKSLAQYPYVRSITDRVDNAKFYKVINRPWESLLPNKSEILAVRFANGGQQNSTIARLLASMNRSDLREVRADNVAISTHGMTEKNVDPELLPLNQRMDRYESHLEAKRGVTQNYVDNQVANALKGLQNHDEHHTAQVLAKVNEQVHEILNGMNERIKASLATKEDIEAIKTRVADAQAEITKVRQELTTLKTTVDNIQTNHESLIRKNIAVTAIVEGLQTRVSLAERGLECGGNLPPPKQPVVKPAATAANKISFNFDF